MNIRRFDVYCDGGWDGCTTYEDDDALGDYVTYDDYNVLRETVKTLLASLDNCEVNANEPAVSVYYRARDMVDKLLGVNAE